MQEQPQREVLAPAGQLEPQCVVAPNNTTQSPRTVRETDLLSFEVFSYDPPKLKRNIYCSIARRHL